MDSEDLLQLTGVFATFIRVISSLIQFPFYDRIRITHKLELMLVRIDSVSSQLPEVMAIC